MLKKKEIVVDTPPVCVACDSKAATGTFFISFNPFNQLRRKAYSEEQPIEKGWSLHAPMCSDCLRQAVKLNVRLDVKNEGTVGFID